MDFSGCAIVCCAGTSTQSTQRGIVMLKILCTLSVFFVFSVSREPNFSADFDRCLDRSGGATYAINRCISAEIRYQDSMLNYHYRELMLRLGPVKKEELKRAQRLWIKYRDANCGFCVGLSGGTIDSTTSADCRMEMTAQRALELKEFLNLIGE